MVRPIVGGVTEDLYAALPAFYRDVDEAQADGPNGYPLLRYLAGITDQLDVVEVLIERNLAPTVDELAEANANTFGVPAPWESFGDGDIGDGIYGEDVSPADLVDPAKADPAWLPWLAQLVGARVDPMAPVATQRAAIANVASTWDHASPAAMRRAVAAVLTGTKYVEVNSPGINATDLPRWTITVRTKASESPASNVWAATMAASPTWAGITNGGSWAAAGQLAIILAAITERPAGIRVRHEFAP
jgi:hypothetical protein